MEKGWVGRAVFESGLIVIGVVLGFIVNEWREGRAAAAEAARSLDRIVAEIELNRSRIKRILPYHQRVAAELADFDYSTLANEEGVQTILVEALFGDIATEGVGDLILQDEAWRTALEQDALAAADFSTLTRIASLYELTLSGPNASWRAIIDQIDEQASFTPAETVPALKRMTLKYQNLVAQEKYVLEEIDRALAEVQGPTGRQSHE
ncbi:MAG: hypothetical protein AAFX08_02160 [Pseudomonadota bacterium]